MSGIINTNTNGTQSGGNTTKKQNSENPNKNNNRKRRKKRSSNKSSPQKKITEESVIEFLKANKLSKRLFMEFHRQCRISEVIDQAGNCRSTDSVCVFQGVDILEEKRLVKTNLQKLQKEFTGKVKKHPQYHIQVLLNLNNNDSKKSFKKVFTSSGLRLLSQRAVSSKLSEKELLETFFLEIKKKEGPKASKTKK